MSIYRNGTSLYQVEGTTIKTYKKGHQSIDLETNERKAKYICRFYEQVPDSVWRLAMAHRGTLNRRLYIKKK